MQFRVFNGKSHEPRLGIGMLFDDLNKIETDRSAFRVKNKFVDQWALTIGCSKLFQSFLIFLAKCQRQKEYLVKKNPQFLHVSTRLN